MADLGRARYLILSSARRMVRTSKCSQKFWLSAGPGHLVYPGESRHSAARLDVRRHLRKGPVGRSGPFRQELSVT